MRVNEILQGDSLSVLRTLPDECVQCCVTSPPYYMLRDYQTGTWQGGNPECNHFKALLASENSTLRNDGRKHTGPYEGEKKRSTGIPYKDVCGKCGAERADQQIGLEDTPEDYISRLVEVFREVKRVLRSDGTAWVNMGDSYANDEKWGGSTGGKHVEALHGDNATRHRRHTGLAPKNLMGMPWRLALALQADGWILRSEIIWHKPTAMPESVTDRPTNAHEHIFLLAKSERYYYDAEAIKEPASTNTHSRGKGVTPKGEKAEIGVRGNNSWHEATKGLVETRNKRTVWTIASQPYPEAHFATFPPKLIEPCILAGTSPHACKHCLAPWERKIERKPMLICNGPKAGGYGSRTTDGLSGTMVAPAETYTIGWQPTCTCEHNTGSGKCIVLDPFSGAGTTALVALQHGRDYLGIELNPAYIRLAERRLQTIQPVLWAM